MITEKVKEFICIYTAIHGTPNLVLRFGTDKEFQEYCNRTGNNVYTISYKKTCLCDVLEKDFIELTNKGIIKDMTSDYEKYKTYKYNVSSYVTLSFQDAIEVMKHCVLIIIDENIDNDLSFIKKEYAV